MGEAIMRWLWRLLAKGHSIRLFYRRSKGLRVETDYAVPAPLARMLNHYLTRVGKGTWLGKVAAIEYMRIKGAAIEYGFRVYVNGKEIKHDSAKNA